MTTSVETVIRWSMKRPLRRAAMMPAVMPMTAVHARAMSASFSVVG